MKKGVLIVSALLVLVVLLLVLVTVTKSNELPGPTTGNVVFGSSLDNGLVSYWKFDGDAVDAIGSNDGVVDGATLATGKSGQAYNFDGTDDYIEIADSSSLKPAAITVSVWVKQDSLTDYDTILMKTTDGTHWNDGYGLAYDDGENTPATPGDNNLVFFVNKYLIADGGGVVMMNPLTLNTWTHIVGTYDGSTVRIYKDGAVASSADYSTPLTHSNEVLLIGRGEPDEDAFKLTLFSVFGRW